MTSFILTAAQMREAEERCIAKGSSVEALMERAGAAVADHAWRMSSGSPILILCGPGNNGGDGYVAARILKARGASVRLAALREPKTPAAIAARQAWSGDIAILEGAADAPILVDGLFGTGLKRILEEEIAAQLKRLMNAARHSIAIDLPSGVDTDGGALLGVPQPFHSTVALGALKPAHRLYPSAGYCGSISVANIGVAAEGPVSAEHEISLSRPGARDHKYRRGVVAVIGGAMPGAAELAAASALRGGAGYVLLLQPERTEQPPHAIVRRHVPQPDDIGALLNDDRIRAALIGPGLGRDADAQARLDQALHSPLPLVIDGDALTLLDRAGPARLKARRSPTILTPHDGEFKALFGDLPGSKIDRALRAAELSGSIVIAKGPDTVLASPAGRAIVGKAASFWLSAAGTGDVLAGLVAARLAIDPSSAFDAASTAIALHGEAARLSGPSFAADDLAASVPVAIQSFIHARR